MSSHQKVLTPFFYTKIVTCTPMCPHTNKSHTNMSSHQRVLTPICPHTNMSSHQKVLAPISPHTKMSSHHFLTPISPTPKCLTPKSPRSIIHAAFAVATQKPSTAIKLAERIQKSNIFGSGNPNTQLVWNSN